MTSAVLIVEDEPMIVDVLELALRRSNVTDVRASRTGADALRSVDSEPPSVVVLDIGLPDTSGLLVAGEIRRRAPDMPLLFLTARDSDADKLRGFEAGADDYVTKPFNPLEVVARVEALLRRSAASSRIVAGRKFAVGDIVIEPQRARLTVSGSRVRMPARELRLLAFLAEHLGVVFSAAELYRAVWGADPLGAVDQNTVSVHVRRIRARIERDPSAPRYLRTVRGLGYQFVEPDEDG
jgi:DNA-binding response OmpR family regulator